MIQDSSTGCQGERRLQRGETGLHYQGVLTRVHAQSGEDRPGPTRLSSLREVFSSPVGAAGRVYVTDRDGTTVVVSHADPPEILAVNSLEDSFSASAAIAGRELFLRGELFLYCIARDAPPE